MKLLMLRAGILRIAICGVVAICLNACDSQFVKEFVNSKNKIKPIKVKVLTLDQYILKSKYKPNFIKIDVEGSEFFVLKGAKKTIIRYKQ